MRSDDSENITPADIEEKIKDFKSELISISGGLSVLQKIGPSAMTLLGVFLRGSTTVSYTHLTLPTTPYV